MKDCTLQLSRENVAELASAIQNAGGCIEAIFGKRKMNITLGEFLDLCSRNNIKLTAVFERPKND